MRYELENVAGQKREVSPLTGKNPLISYTRADKRRYDFKREIKEISFTGEDYKYFAGIESGDFRCTQHILHVYNDCPPLADDLVFTGSFSSTSGSWDLDQCNVKFKVEETDEYTCLDENDDKINIFDFLIPRRSIDMGISVKYLYDAEDETSGTYEYTNLIMRITVPEGFKAPDDWFYEGIAPGFQNRYDYRKEYQDYSSETKIPYNEPFSIIDNTFPLQDLLHSLVFAVCSIDITVKSEFFEWNLEFPVPDSQNKYRNLFIAQKSDVKRPSASNNATKGEMNALDLIEALCNIFNLGYHVSNGVLQLEHISYFADNYGIDLNRSKRHEFLLKGTRKYSYDNTKLPKYERFEMMEAGNVDFIGEPISYENSCVNNDPENKSEISIDFITTDILHCLENFQSESEEVSDDGFVLIACDVTNTIRFEPGILTEATPLNNTLSWAHLHRDLWKFGRVLESGMMNGELTDFTSTAATIKQDKFNVVLSCPEIRRFDPMDQLRATLGWGFIQSAELSLLDCTLSIQMNLNTVNPNVNFEESFGDFDVDFDTDFD